MSGFRHEPSSASREFTHMSLSVTTEETIDVAIGAHSY